MLSYSASRGSSPKGQIVINQSCVITPVEPGAQVDGNALGGTIQPKQPVPQNAFKVCSIWWNFCTCVWDIQAATTSTANPVVVYVCACMCLFMFTFVFVEILVWFGSFVRLLTCCGKRHRFPRHGKGLPVRSTCTPRANRIAMDGLVSCCHSHRYACINEPKHARPVSIH